MESMVRRPLAVFGLSFVLAGFSGIHFSPVVRWSLLALCGLLFLLSFLPFFQRSPASLRRTARILLGGILGGLLLLSLYTDLSLARPARQTDRQSASVTGIIREKEYATSYSAGYVLDITEGIAKGCRILLETPDSSFSPGQEIRCTAEFSAFAENSGGFAEEQYYFSRGISMRGETEDPMLTGKNRMGLSTLLSDFRSALSARLQVCLGRRDSALPAALFLGDRTGLDDALSRDMRCLGISHMLAISGLHFTILLGAAEYLLKKILPSKKPRLLLLAGLCVFYMALAGFSASVLRAGLMMLITYAAALLHRESDFYTSLALAALLICLGDPASFYSVGLQLSVLSVAVLGCAVRLESVVFGPVIPSPRLRKILFAFLLPILVQTGLLPLLCLYFGEASLMTPVATVLFTPLITLLLYLTPVLVMMPFLAPLAMFVRLLVQCITALAGWTAQLRGITVPLNYALCPIFALLLCGVLLSTGFLTHRRQAVAALCTAGILFAGFGTYLGICTAVTREQNAVLSVQAKSNDALVVFSRGKALLLDISDGSYSALRTFYASAREHHVTEAEALMLTHLHKRHIHSFIRLSSSTYVRNLILPVPVTESEESIAYSLREEAEARGIPVYFYDAAANPTVRFGETEILPGKRTYLSRSTHPVITVQVRCQDESVQYLGTSWNETDECPSPARSQLLILGVHGPIYKSAFTLAENMQTETVLVRGGSAEFAGNLPPGKTRESDTPILFSFGD